MLRNAGDLVKEILGETEDVNNDNKTLKAEIATMQAKNWDVEAERKCD